MSSLSATDTAFNASEKPNDDFSLIELRDPQLGLSSLHRFPLSRFLIVQLELICGSIKPQFEVNKSQRRREDHPSSLASLAT
jgi:hypothetical protein